MAREPHHFTREDLIRAFFGSFIVSLSFMFAGSLIVISAHMAVRHVFFLTILTMVILTFEIYLLSYKYVNDKKHRPFLEFWAKRFFSIILSSIIAIMLLFIAYGMENYVTSLTDLMKVAVAMFLPAATVGGAMEILRKK